MHHISTGQIILAAIIAGFIYVFLLYLMGMLCAVVYRGFLRAAPKATRDRVVERPVRQFERV